MQKTHFRWIVVAVLFLICIVNYVDRSAISYAITAIGRDFHLTPSEQGLILGAFGIGYFVTTLLGGVLVDRYGARLILGLATILWSFSIGLTGVATGFIMLYLLRISLGVSEGPNFPTVTKAISDWLPQKERAFALSLSLVSVPLALAIGGPIVTQLMLHTSWRGMFIILGLLGLFWLPLWFWLFRNTPAQSPHVSPQELEHITGHAEARPQQTHHNKPGTWKFLLTNPTLLTTYFAFFVFGYFLFFFMAWLPGYLEHQYHLNLTQIGLFSILPWATATVLLALVGYLSDQLFRKTGSLRKARTYPIVIMQFLAALSVLPIVYAHSVIISVISLSLAIGFSMGANAPFYAVVADLAKMRSGTALGIMDSTFAFAGFLAPVLTGFAVQRTGSFTGAFLVLFILALISAILMLCYHQPDRCKTLEDYVGK